MGQFFGREFSRRYDGSGESSTSVPVSTPLLGAPLEKKRFIVAATLVHIENGERRELRFTTIRLLSTALDISIDELGACAGFIKSKGGVPEPTIWAPPTFLTAVTTTISA
jgi:hypothetical protein